MQKESSNNIMECQQEVGRTTDEILLYYIDKYECEKNINDREFAYISEMAPSTIVSMRKSVRDMNAGRKKISTYRTKNLILKVAVYTNMPYPDVKLALELSGHAFNRIDPRDVAFVEWLCKDDLQRDVRELNDLILKRCKAIGLTEDQIEKYMYPDVPINK